MMADKVKLTNPDSTPTAAATDADLEIRAALEKEVTKLRSIFQQEGGDCRILSLTEGVARVSLANECAGCSSGVMQMAGGLRLMLLERIPGLKDLVFE